MSYLAPASLTMRRKATFRPRPSVLRRISAWLLVSLLLTQSHSSSAVKSMWRAHPKLPSIWLKGEDVLSMKHLLWLTQPRDWGQLFALNIWSNANIYFCKKQWKQTASNSGGRGGLPNIFSQLRQTFGKHFPMGLYPYLIFLSHVEVFPNLSSAVLWHQVFSLCSVYVGMFVWMCLCTHVYIPEINLGCHPPWSFFF